ncbi:MAG: zf-TFIIB domain-containing protein [Polyangiaceae bacterium]|nr:zf-TFIIB domain-containing protein [Polyangiaceae bacterium]
MAEVHAGGLVLDRCGTCHGLWFDRRELSTLLDLYRLGEAIPHSLPNPSAQRVEHVMGVCPRCDIALERSETVAVPGLHWDTCSRCAGAWLDGGELAEAAADPDAAAALGFFAKLP